MIGVSVSIVMLRSSRSENGVARELPWDLGRVTTLIAAPRDRRSAALDGEVAGAAARPATAAAGVAAIAAAAERDAKW